MARHLSTAFRAWLRRHRALLWVTIAALLVRLVWNLWAHPPSQYAYSDMAGYVDRANELFDLRSKPPSNFAAKDLIDVWYRRLFDTPSGRPSAYLTLFPFGTHVLIYLVKLLFGRDSAAGLGFAYAVFGTVAVAFTYATAERLVAGRWARRLVGALLVVYYPWIALGGYSLSEIPFAMCVSASAFYSLRLADRGRRTDALGFGLAAALGTLVRPQMLVAVALIGLFALVRRRAFRRRAPQLALLALFPLSITLGIAAARTHYHTAHYGLVSTNGPLNFVFGRCHNTTLSAHTKRGGAFFGPPPLGALAAYEKDHPHPLFSLSPAMGLTLSFEGDMWDAAPNRKLAEACIAKTGLIKQGYYAITHVVLLWGYNIIWPDQGSKHHGLRLTMAIACIAHAALLLPGALVALALAFRRKQARLMIVALQLWSVVLTAMLYFGDTRYRAPYDGVIIILAAVGWPAVWRGAQRLRDRLRRAP